MKKYLMLLLAGIGGLAWAQTNEPATAPAPMKSAPSAEIQSKHFYFDANSREAVYESQVVITYPKLKLTCERLTISIPANNEHPTNAVAETNVVIEMLDEKGQTNFVTSDKATYAYSVVNSVTNETIIFTGGDPMPKAETSQLIFLGYPLTLNLVTKKYGGSNFRTIFKQAPNLGNGTNNATPFNFLK